MSHARPSMAWGLPAVAITAEKSTKAQCCCRSVPRGARRQGLFRLVGEFLLGDGSVGVHLCYWQLDGLDRVLTN